MTTAGWQTTSASIEKGVLTIMNTHRKALAISGAVLGLELGSALANTPTHVEPLHWSPQPVWLKGFAAEDAEVTFTERLDAKPAKAYKRPGIVPAPKRLVCEDPKPMVGVPGGPARAAYGRVGRCEWM